MDIKFYDTLPLEAVEIRKLVFVEEQGFKNEFDEIDIYASHLVMFKSNVPIATCRFFKKQHISCYVIGRIAVIKEYRGQKLGAELIKKAEEIVCKNGGKYIMLHAQIQAQHFYEKQGYLPYGEIEYDENCPHIWMSKKIMGKEDAILE
ncbi:GNAT family N-acetyltransferase [Petralouisia muris]|uniref:GNAT family N-acetyltransferase n=1 Tax=Petralouisia muris TaxID=3032872 RepID=A0AC61S344_9FIRM|nr:GNAT family N-acetyltransferase [Petralouisia muris]TGY98369.1 GNAT family N-acetyltransferase [Petralouisia muris]